MVEIAIAASNAVNPTPMVRHPISLAAQLCFPNQNTANQILMQKLQLNGLNGTLKGRLAYIKANPTIAQH